MIVPAAAAFDALAGARHPDPFAFLGPHVEDGHVVIRAFLPSAERVEVLHAGGGPTELSRAHGTGGFEAAFPATEIFDYTLRATYASGHVAEIDDPYRYGRIITEYDVYLFSQGKHTRVYDKLGAHLTHRRQRERRALRRLGPQRRPRQRGRRFQRMGRARASDAAAWTDRCLGDFHSRPDRRAALQYEIRSTQHGELLLKSDRTDFVSSGRRCRRRSSLGASTSGTTRNGS